jgi:hypothetical protein
MPPIRRHPATGDGDRLTSIEAHQCGVDQFADIHHGRDGIDVATGALPDLGSCRGRQHGLHVDAAGAKLDLQRL